MRKLVIILIAFIAAVTFIRAFDNTGDLSMNVSPDISEQISEFN
jgi:hypothetical protein